MNQSIAFAHFKNGELVGFRTDTFGSLSKTFAKLYMYSESQVEIVLSGIRYNLGEKKPSFGEALKNANADPVACDMISKAEEKIYKDAQDLGAFEVRVVKAPSKIYEKTFNIKTAEWETDRFGQYPEAEDMKKWCEDWANHEIIEIHYFSMVDKLNLQ